MSHRRHQKACPKCGQRTKDVVKHVLHHHGNDRSVDITPMLPPSKRPVDPPSRPIKRDPPPAPDWRHPTFAGTQRSYGTINVWTCSTCQHRTIARDLHEGVTPFIIGCTAPGCDGDAQSGFYRREHDQLADQVTHHWRFPTEAEFAELHPMERDHVQRGGLVMYAGGSSLTGMKQVAGIAP